MTGTPDISVVIRAKDEAPSIGRVVELVRSQTVAVNGRIEIVVVDSGSRDGTPDIARRAGAKVLEIPAASFTFGGALNLGCSESGGELIVALSAHAFPQDERWLERLAAVFTDERVAAACGDQFGPDGAPLRGQVVQDLALARRNRHWGYSNADGMFRADLWRQRHFRADMPGTEDKEWAWHWLERGRTVVLGPDLRTDHDHSKESFRSTLQRAHREWRGYDMYVPLTPYGARDLMREWWTEQESYVNRRRARLSHRRAARLLGMYAVRRRPGRALRAPAERVPLGPPLRVAVLVDRYPVLSETFVTREIEALARLGHDVRVEAVARPPNGEVGTAPAGVPVTHLVDEPAAAKARDLLWLAVRWPLRCLRDLREQRVWRAEEPVPGLRALAGRARRLRREGVDHLHVHFATRSAQEAARLGRLLDLPHSVTAHGYDIFLTPRNLVRKLEDATFATSGCEYNVRHLRDVAPAAAERIHEVVMGVDGDAFRSSAPHPSGRRVLAVGRLVEKKGFGVLLEAVARLTDRAAVELEVIGDGPLRAHLHARASELGLDGIVTFAGARGPTEVREALERADLLAVPCVVAEDGDRDSMPVVAKEALAMEVPVVASDEVGLPELVRPEWGALVAPGDSEALAGAIERILALTPDERAAMGAAGRAWVLEHCDLYRETARLAELIASGVAARAARG